MKIPGKKATMEARKILWLAKYVEGLVVFRRVLENCPSSKTIGHIVFFSVVQSSC
jgi:hypothetical protein